MDHYVLLLKHLSNQTYYMHFIRNGLKCFFKDQLARSKATCPFNERFLSVYTNKCNKLATNLRPETQLLKLSFVYSRPYQQYLSCQFFTNGLFRDINSNIILRRKKLKPYQNKKPLLRFTHRHKDYFVCGFTCISESI